MQGLVQDVILGFVGIFHEKVHSSWSHHIWQPEQAMQGRRASHGLLICSKQCASVTGSRSGHDAANRSAQCGTVIRICRHKLRCRGCMQGITACTMQDLLAAVVHEAILPVELVLVSLALVSRFCLTAESLHNVEQGGGVECTGSTAKASHLAS